MLTGVLAGRHGPAALSRQSPATPEGMTPSAATPASTPLPLYTPIPVHKARNVVGQARIELTDRGFIPSRFENAYLLPITFTLVNTGTRLHTFTIDELDVHVEVPPGETQTLTIPAPPKLKRYVYYSDTPEDRVLGMKGYMTIFL